MKVLLDSRSFRGQIEGGGHLTRNKNLGVSKEKIVLVIHFNHVVYIVS